MIKDQLAKLQSELRINRNPSQLLQPSSNSSTTTTTTTTLHQKKPTPPPPNNNNNNNNNNTPKSITIQQSLPPTKPNPSYQPTDGLSIRFISGPGIPSTRSLSSTSSPSPSRSRSSLSSSSPSSSSSPYSSKARKRSLSTNHRVSRSRHHMEPQPAPSFPITDSGFIKDSGGNWVPMTNCSPPKNHPLLSPQARSPQPPPPPSSSVSPLESSSPRPPSSKIPISTVALGRVLAGDPLVTHDHRSQPTDHHHHHQSQASLDQIKLADHSNHHQSIKPQPENHPHPFSSSSSSSLPPSPSQPNDPDSCQSPEPSSTLSTASLSRQPRNNPFFSSGGGRDRGAMIHQAHHHQHQERGTNGGNTGKVITTLQSDLLYARTTLDQSKSQLRLSQRAVESLNRQNDDLKDSMSRLRLENEGLSKMLNRKERTVAELMERVKRSESELSTLKQEKKELDVNHKKLTKETDELVKDALRRRDRAETQYEAVRSGVKSLSEGWKRDVSELKQDIARLEEKHRKEMEDSRMKYNTLAKLHASRSGALSRIETNLQELQSSKESFIDEYSKELRGMQETLEREAQVSMEGLELARQVSVECARFKRHLRDYSSSSSSQN